GAVGGVAVGGFGGAVCVGDCLDVGVRVVRVVGRGQGSVAVVDDLVEALPVRVVLVGLAYRAAGGLICECRGGGQVVKRRRGRGAGASVKSLAGLPAERVEGVAGGGHA